jgi:hypothetical protein
MVQSISTRFALHEENLYRTPCVLQSSTRACHGSIGCALFTAMQSSLPSQTAEDYLERIHELIRDKGYARVVNIASSLDVKQASARPR